MQELEQKVAEKVKKSWNYLHKCKIFCIFATRITWGKEEGSHVRTGTMRGKGERGKRATVND